MSITKHCGSWLLYNKATGDARRFFCGLVTCDRPECRKKFYVKRVRLISDLAEEYGLDKFFTLTVGREMPVEIAWKAVAGIWNKFLTVIRRKHNGFVYVAVLESHNPLVEGKRTLDGVNEDWGGCDDCYESFLGYPHIHGVTSSWIAQEEYSRHFSACGGGEVAWVEKITGDISGYLGKQLGKYFGKQNLLMAKETMGKGKRTIWRSVGLKTKRELREKSENWKLLKENCFGAGGEILYNIFKDGDEFVAVCKRITGNNFEIRG